jgi:hypothetical protein
MDVLHLHLARAFALYAAIAARYDVEPSGPTYEEQAMLAELDAGGARSVVPASASASVSPSWQA